MHIFSPFLQQWFYSWLASPSPLQPPPPSHVKVIKCALSLSVAISCPCCGGLFLSLSLSLSICVASCGVVLRVCGAPSYSLTCVSIEKILDIVCRSHATGVVSINNRTPYPAHSAHAMSSMRMEQATNCGASKTAALYPSKQHKHRTHRNTSTRLATFAVTVLQSMSQLFAAHFL